MSVDPLWLHLPDEPERLRERWRCEINAGGEIETILFGDAGVADWLWSRWMFLERTGWTRTWFIDVVRGARRELWLWLAGERTWEGACSTVIGRVSRRAPH